MYVAYDLVSSFVSQCSHHKRLSSLGHFKARLDRQCLSQQINAIFPREFATQNCTEAAIRQDYFRQFIETGVSS